MTCIARSGVRAGTGTQETPGSQSQSLPTRPCLSLPKGQSSGEAPPTTATQHLLPIYASTWALPAACPATLAVLNKGLARVDQPNGLSSAVYNWPVPATSEEDGSLQRAGS